MKRPQWGKISKYKTGDCRVGIADEENQQAKPRQPPTNVPGVRWKLLFSMTLAAASNRGNQLTIKVVMTTQPPYGRAFPLLHTTTKRDTIIRSTVTLAPK
jgi:hypothetical protein